jgi:hypothetical protein
MLTENDFEKWLDDLGPADTSRDLNADLERFTESIPDARRRVEDQLRYLQLVSSRRVALPDELYFARVRQRLFERVEIKPVSIWAKLRALLIPERLSPVPGAVIGGILTLLLVALLLQPQFNDTGLSGYERYLSMTNRISADLELQAPGDLMSLLDIEEITLLYRSAAILTSPSSLSRSWTLGTGMKIELAP